jgi:hypothetical protein
MKRRLQQVPRQSEAATSNKMSAFDIEKYFASIGVALPKSEAVFVKNGRKRFGSTFEQMKSVMEDRGKWSDY